MTKSKMKKLAMAMGVVLGGIGMAPSTQAMNLATDGLGQVLIFPYYTVQGGWATLFNITNTSDQIVAAKVRFHESLNSRDVFDFNVVMSPRDVWNGWVANNGNGPSFFTADTTCTTLSPLPVNLATEGVPFVSPALGTDGTIAYTGAAADGGSTAVTRMNEGYVEIITMAISAEPPATPVTPGSTLLRGALHINGAAPTGCNDLAAAFLTPGGGAGGTDFGTLGLWFVTPAGLNPLKGSYNLLNGAEGWTASGVPTTIANFTTASLLTMTLPPNPPVVPFDLSFLEPSLNSGNTAPVGTGQDDAALSVGAAAGGVNAVSGLLARTHVINQWSRITDASNAWVTATDWVLTFPTKAFYVDNWPASNFSARAAARTVPAGTTIPVAVPAAFPTPFTQTFDDSVPNPVVRRGESCDTMTPAVFNREEVRQLGAGISPGAGNQLCFEANVLTLGAPGTVGSNILNSATARGVTPLPGANGYMDIPLAAASAVNIPQGLPVIGFMVTTRDTGGVLNEAFLVDHAYSRRIPPANP
ncbi:MAG TPA: hypothetical protein PLD30_02850 [Candidatus Competibacteraceae bacterium]|nr:hypothetical protein [Candidatus Competibacteraceae bacterium]